MASGIFIGPDLDQHQLPLYGAGGCHLKHPLHVVKLLNLPLDLLNNDRVTGDDDRDTAYIRSFGLTYRKGVDIVAASGEKTHDPHEDTSLVVDKDCQSRSSLHFIHQDLL